MALATKNQRRFTRVDWTDFAHTGPGTLAGAYLRRFWQPIYRSEDLAPGTAVPIRVMSQDLTLYRGTAGDPHLLAMRCAHRGTQLSTGWVEGDALRCRYHGWLYNGSGQCLEQPGEPTSFCERVRIGSFPVGEYLGHVFSYLGEGEPPPLINFPNFLDGDRFLEVLKTDEAPCNYFQRLENEPDEIHLLFAHRYGKPYSSPSKDEIPTIHAEETEYGLVQIGERAVGVRRTHLIMPNIRYTSNHPRHPEEHGPRRRIMWRVPIDDEHYATFAVLAVDVHGADVERYREHRAEVAQLEARFDEPAALQAILRGKLRIEDLEFHPDIVGGLEDDVVQVGQGAIADRSAEMLAPSDIGVVVLRQLWAREMRALAEGRPLKKWVIPLGLTTSEYLPTARAEQPQRRT